MIAKAGKPMVKVVGIEQAEGAKPPRIGFMKGQISAPEDFDELRREEIEGRFGSSR